jgi:geranylgeranyl diphosphate synthase, type II
MQRANQIIVQIETAIAKLSVAREPKGLYGPIIYSLQNGGKRIRPTLTVLACEMYNKNLTDEAIDLALAFEVFHNFTLLHDDLMDNAPMRRGLPTVHVKWNENTAILSGDAMLVEAYKLVSKTKGSNSHKIISLFSTTAQQVCEGQMLDMEFEQRNQVSEKEYLDMIKLKTSVLLGACLKAGAWLGGATDAEAAHLYDFGINMGLAFQLKDDLLDTFGNETNFGKKTGGDILEAKKTYLVIKALEMMGDKRGQLIDALHSNNMGNDEKVETVKSIFVECDCEKLTSLKMEEYSRHAEDILHKLESAGRNISELRQMEQYLLNREK